MKIFKINKPGTKGQKRAQDGNCKCFQRGRHLREPGAEGVSERNSCGCTSHLQPLTFENTDRKAEEDCVGHSKQTKPHSASRVARKLRC